MTLYNLCMTLEIPALGWEGAAKLLSLTRLTYRHWGCRCCGCWHYGCWHHVQEFSLSTYKTSLPPVLFIYYLFILIDFKLILLILNTKYYLIFYQLCYYICLIFPPFTLYSPPPCTPPPTHIPPFSWCPWVIHISPLASIFLILFLTSPSIFYLPFMLLIPCALSPSSLLPSPLITLLVISISVILFLF